MGGFGKCIHFSFHPKCVSRVVLLALVATLSTNVIVADHLEPEQQAKGKAEHFLSGIEVKAVGENDFSTSLAAVIKIYGPPNSKRDFPVDKDSEKIGGQRQYIWMIHGLRLGVWTWYHNDHETGVSAVDVWGDTSSDGIGVTGQGLKLGSTFQQQKAIYGARFFNSTPPEYLPRVKSALLEWKDGTQMDIDYGSDERITHIQLSADTE